ncbi:alcohol dehydrogenase family protein [Photobacterium sp. ZSDE20]|uniref:Alcohol dehydrogenase family protein n=1 Tax=Photobacterium pectinilyticum TaxID=2906793 RepID=A0ABT1MYV0_9GAMM|nr:alcohol dehydrogenase family protein [Photobacterium sp. ZSDE20]MCQ1057668.1 alcohol dehydrogenase family protein [Photobacterium sp. ZSDE20]MDD1821927.1 alcohol dehydrogenase family protein [Photobacterium sp. ZSDE20]
MEPKWMKAIVTVGQGGYEQLVYKDVALPPLEHDEVLVQVHAAGMNNTEINTRLGWYSSSITDSTNNTSDSASPSQQQKSDGGWNKSTPFPLIQGTDCCGTVVSAADNSHRHLVGKRVLLRPCQRGEGFDNVWLGSDFNGAFAQFTKVKAKHAFAIECEWSDAELATIPCAYGTAENMLHRANLVEGETVLIAGASGGVGSAAIQLAKRRGAKIIAIASRDKHPQLEKLAVDLLLDRNDDLISLLGENSVDLVVDNVAGKQFPTMLKVLKRGGRLVSSGAIAGPVVDLDMRDMYLKDITLIGTTAWDDPVFPNLIGYIERGEIQPLLAKTFPLEEITAAQQAFLEKKHVGNFVLIPSSQG